MRARTRDRLVHWASHPLVFLALELGRRVPLPGRIVVDSAEGVRHVLTAVPLDRSDARTTGGLVQREGSAGESWFDGEGAGHRASRRALGRLLGRDGIRELQPLWRGVLEETVAAIRHEPVDAVTMARLMAGLLTAPMLGVAPTRQFALDLTAATRRVASRSVAGHLRGRAPRGLTDELERLVPGLTVADAMLATAATTTLLSAVPRALAWCADDRLWGAAARDPSTLAAELARVLAPSPLLPRTAADTGEVDGRRFPAGTQLLLHLLPAIAGPDPDVDRPQPAAVSQLAFGVGSHACPGRAGGPQGVAHAPAAFAPVAPTVARAVPDRAAGLPQWRELWLA